MTERDDVEKMVLDACRDDGGGQVAAKMFELMVPSVCADWLYGSDSHLGGARPIDVLQLEGSGPVLDALAAFEQGAFG